MMRVEQERVSPETRDPNTRREVRTVTAEALGWYGSIFLWLLFTGIGVPPCPEEAGIIYAAGVTALHPDVKWWLAWPATGAGIVAADMVLYGIGRLWGRRLFDYRWVDRKSTRLNSSHSQISYAVFCL